MKTSSNLETELARAELTDTMEQLVDRLNFSRRIDQKVREIQLRLHRMRRNQPLSFVALLAGAGAVVALVVVGIVRIILRCPGR